MKVRVEYVGAKLAGSESSEAKISSFIFDRNVAEVDSEQTKTYVCTY